MHRKDSCPFLIHKPDSGNNILGFPHRCLPFMEPVLKSTWISAKLLRQQRWRGLHIWTEDAPLLRNRRFHRSTDLPSWPTQTEPLCHLLNVRARGRFEWEVVCRAVCGGFLFSRLLDLLPELILHQARPNKNDRYLCSLHNILAWLLRALKMFL